MKHVISLENAKKLQELGVKKGSYFAYEDYSPYLLSYSFCSKVACDGYVPAYTVGELGEMLPTFVDRYYFAIDKHDENKWTAGYFDHINILYHAGLTAIDKNEADTRAKLLIKLIENGHVKASEL